MCSLKILVHILCPFLFRLIVYGCIEFLKSLENSYVFQIFPYSCGIYLSIYLYMYLLINRISNISYGWWYQTLLYNLYLKKNFFWREREVGEGQRKREKETFKQSPGPARSWSGAQSHNAKIMIWAEIESQTLFWLSQIIGWAPIICVF